MRYSMLIQWSDEDQAYLVTFPEWEGHIDNPVTHGATYEEAVQAGHEVLAGLIDLWNDKGWPRPEPRLFAPAAAS